MRKNAYWAHLQIRGGQYSSSYRLPDRREKGSTKHDFSLNVRLVSFVNEIRLLLGANLVHILYTG